MEEVVPLAKVVEVSMDPNAAPWIYTRAMMVAIAGGLLTYSVGIWWVARRACKKMDAQLDEIQEGNREMLNMVREWNARLRKKDAEARQS